MNLSPTTPNIAARFTPEPDMPWLRTDPRMQERAAFHHRKEVTLSPGYDLMAPYFPAGSTLALMRISSPDQLGEGVYWLEQYGRRASFYGDAPVHYQMGRYERTDTTYKGRNKRKLGSVRLAMSDDNPQPDCPRRADGTIDWYVDFDNHEFRLYRVSHYVRVPLELVPEADQDRAVLAMGASPAQARWLREEARIVGDEADEISTLVLGGGFPEPDQRVLLGKVPGYGNARGQISTFALILSDLQPLTQAQACKRKAGAVKITVRSVTITGLTYTYPRYFKQEDVQVLLDWFTGLNRLQRAEEAVAQAAAKVQVARDLAKHAQERTSVPSTVTAAQPGGAYEPTLLQAA